MNPSLEIGTTDDFHVFRRVRTQARRLMTSGVKNGRAWDKATNIGEVSAATKIPPAEVVRLIDVCGHLLFVEREETKPMIAWIVFEDGE